MIFNKELNPDLYNFYEENDYLIINQICKGNGITIALLDTGMDYYNQGLASRVSLGYSMFGDPKYYFDNVGHGTFMASLLNGKEHGVLSQASIIPIKVIDDEGNTSLEILSKALYKCIEFQVDIVYFPIAFNITSPELENAIQSIKENDILLVAAYPNRPKEDTIYYPSSYPSVCSIGINGTTHLKSFEGKCISAGVRNSQNIDEGSSSVASLIAVIFFAMLKEWLIKRQEWVSWEEVLNNLEKKYIRSDGKLSFNRINDEYQFSTGE